MRGEQGRDRLQMGRQAGQNEGSLTELSISHSYSLSALSAAMEEAPVGAQAWEVRACTGVVDIGREAASGSGLEFSVHHKCAHHPKLMTRKPQKGQ